MNFSLFFLFTLCSILLFNNYYIYQLYNTSVFENKALQSQLENTAYVKNVSRCLSSLYDKPYLNSIKGDESLIIHEFQPDELSSDMFLKLFVFQDQPVIIRNAINHWPAFEKWKDLNYISRKFGNRRITVEQSNQLLFEGYGENYKPKSMFFNDFINKLDSNKENTNGTLNYLVECNGDNLKNLIKDDITELEYARYLVPEIDDIDYVKAANLPFPRSYQYLKDIVCLWIGNSKITSRLHIDPFANLYAVITGEKKWTIFDPTMTDNLYIYAKTDDFSKSPFSRVSDFDNLIDQYKEYPNLQNVRKTVLTLNSGDLLFLPPQFWHEVENHDDLTVAINFKYYVTSLLNDLNLEYWQTDLINEFKENNSKKPQSSN